MDSTYNSSIPTIKTPSETLKEKFKDNNEKKFSIALAKVNFLLDEIPYSGDELLLKYEEVATLINKLRVLTDMDTSLIIQLCGYFDLKLNRIVNLLVIEPLHRELNNSIFVGNRTLSQDKILLEKVYILIELIYSISEKYKITINTEITISLCKLLKSLELSYFNNLRNRFITNKFYHSDIDNLNQGSIISDKYSYKDDNRKELEKILDLIHKCIINILLNCDPVSSIFQMLSEVFLTNRGNIVRFSNEIDTLLKNYNTKRSSKEDIELILRLTIFKLSKHPKINENKHVLKKLVNSYKSIYKSSIIPIDSISIPGSTNKKTVIKITEKHPKKYENQNYKFHLNKQVKEPAWINIFYDNTVQQQYSTSNNVVEGNCSKEQKTEEFKGCNISDKKTKIGKKSKIKTLFSFNFSSHKNPNCKICKFLPLHTHFHRT